jgi:hypothetical protein
MRRFWLSYPEPNKALERTGHTTGFFHVQISGGVWPAAHR